MSIPTRPSMEASDLTQPIFVTSLRDKIAERLRDCIAEGVFPPGKRLTEKELCTFLGVSRTSVREALRQIESEGLVTNISNKGPIVSVVTADDAENIFETRAVLESLIARLYARRASDAQLKALREAFAVLKASYAEGNLPEMLRAKRHFYSVLFEGAANEIAASALRSIHIKVTQLRSMSLATPGRAEKSLSEVRQIVTLICKRDEEGAAAAATKHVQNACQTALKALSSAPSQCEE